MKKQYSIIVVSLVISALVTAFLYSKIPESVASHWNAEGVVDGYMSKNSNILFFFGLMIGMPLFMAYMPKLDPKYQNVRAFEGNFEWFIVVMSLFFTALYFFSLAWSLGYQFPIHYFIIPAMAILFFSIGKLIETAKQNYTIGIRVPWTLASEENWNVTHKLSAKVFIWGSPFIALCAFLGNYAFYGFMFILLIITIVPIAYSYWYFRQEKPKK
jgi:uncharacterized membrane protein